ncbi:MAG: ribosomal RNA small subunit methyltransferase A [Gemmatimonadetes bacterium]|nr:ribosomal RNA small subunit methyltransferase A [Gemmatimonadota bacterium]
MTSRVGGHTPRKRFGQHFLKDRAVLAAIADAAALQPGETAVEIGPGQGALTELLIERVRPTGRLIAVEIDRDLAAGLRARYALRPECEIIEGDFLNVALGPVVRGPYTLVGNIPYNITTPIVFKALESPRPRSMVFLVQREVAERVAAAPGTDSYGALSVNLQALATAETLRVVPARAFAPPPKVDSAVLKIVPLAAPLLPREDESSFRKLVTALFSNRRKQMQRALRSVRGLSAPEAAAALEAADIAATARPEVLAPADFARLLRVLRGPERA